jgi:hypothetical protein
LDEIFRAYTFWGLEIESVIRFLMKIVVARENSANFEFLMKTAHFNPIIRAAKMYKT